MIGQIQLRYPARERVADQLMEFGLNECYLRKSALHTSLLFHA